MKRACGLSLLLLALVGGGVGCDIQRIAVDQTATVLKRSLPAFEREWDFELAASALPPNLKMIEGLLISAPDNQDLLLMLARAYTGYALIVLEDALERAQAGDEIGDSPAVERLGLRVREMYLRAHRYGLRLLELRRPGFRAAFASGREPLDSALAACEAPDVPGLFWTTMALASAINVARDDVMLIGLIDKTRRVLERIVALDERYYDGGAHLALGALHGSIGGSIGGDPKRAEHHFKRALQISGRRLLLVQELAARTLAVQLQDRALFERLLGEVARAKLSIYPDRTLANVAAKRRARRTLARADELF